MPEQRSASSSTYWHSLSEEQVLQRLESTASGLTDTQVQHRLRQFGHNRLPEPQKRSILRRFLAQCHNVLIYVLIFSALVTALMAHWVDSAVIFTVVLINALIGLIQEGKAESAILALRHLLSNQAMVMRNRMTLQVPAELLVPGDIVSLQAGDKVPADLRLLHTKGLQIQESVLTGESVPVAKNTTRLAADTVLADQSCMAFSGTSVTYGQGSGVVVATGAETEIGRISTLLTQVKSLDTPLLRQMTRFGHQLTGVIIVISLMALLFGVWVYQFSWSEMFIAVVVLAVAAIPEGLPAIVTITLAIGVQKMAARKAIIRSLPVVEALGSVTVICSDKTGTLTRNEMMVTNVVTAIEGDFEISGQGYDPHGSIYHAGKEVDAESFSSFFRTGLAAALCNDSHLLQQNGDWQLQGDPTEAALLTFALKAGIDIEDQRKRWPRLDSIPFESEYQFMASLHHDHQGHHLCYLKGAPEKVLQMCQTQLSADRVAAIDKTYWYQQLERLAAEGLRVLAVASKPMPETKMDLSFTDVSDGLTLCALVAMIDPPRQEAVTALRQCQSAGIEVKMITGDHEITAAAVARLMGLSESSQVLNARQLEQMDDQALSEAVSTVQVFARTSPEQKLRLVNALQANGEVVAMTGDGVNDAPALKRADIGAAMGIKGSEVARDAADMVLADDNFASIVDAVVEGRTVYDNLKKAILFILPTSAGEALIILAAILLGIALPITPVQILWVNMITAVTLGLALAFEPGEAGVMLRKPRPSDEPLLSRALAWRVIFVALIMMTGCFGLFLWEMAQGSSVDYARTVAVNTLVMFEIFYLFNSRYLTQSVLNWQGLTGNRYVLLAVMLLVLFQFAFTYLPWMQFLFGSVALAFHSWLQVLLVASSVFWLVELEKAVIRLLQTKKSRAV